MNINFYRKVSARKATAFAISQLFLVIFIIWPAPPLLLVLLALLVGSLAFVFYKWTDSLQRKQRQLLEEELKMPVIFHTNGRWLGHHKGVSLPKLIMSSRRGFPFGQLAATEKGLLFVLDEAARNTGDFGDTEAFFLDFDYIRQYNSRGFLPGGGILEFDYDGKTMAVSASSHRFWKKLLNQQLQKAVQ